MDARREPVKTIDEYIAQFPPEIRDKLLKVRQTIREETPDADETISYRIPTFRLNGNLVHFAAFRDHISFFPTSSGVEAFKKELSGFKTSKGTIQFPLDKPMPLDLVRKIVRFRVRENLGKRAPEKRTGKKRAAG